MGGDWLVGNHKEATGLKQPLGISKVCKQQQPQTVYLYTLLLNTSLGSQSNMEAFLIKWPVQCRVAEYSITKSSTTANTS